VNSPLETLKVVTACLVATGICHAQGPSRPLVDQTRFMLVSTDQAFSLRQPDGADMPVPREWLIPARTEQEEADNLVSSFAYDERVSSFRIGPTKIGIQVSSFDASGGSAQAAAGRDAFLVLDETSHRLYPGILDLGVTKSRDRLMGCPEAESARFLLADLNGDGFLDVGVRRERLTCRTVTREEVDAVDGPYYESEPIRWYVFNRDGWSREASLDGRFPRSRYWELPLINLAKTTVDFVMDASRQSR
jgi:hypothetical protein